MAIFLVIDTMAIAAVSPFGGIIADRLNRKDIMVWMDAIRGFVVLIAAFLLYRNLLQIWMLYFSALVLGFCGAIFSPAANAIIPNIVTEDQLAQATSANQFTVSLCTMVGMMTGGILYSWIGILAIFLLNAISYFISGVMEACVEIPFKKQNDLNQNISIDQELSKVIKELNEGYRYVKGNKAVYYLLLVNTVFNVVALPIGLVYTSYYFNVILKAAPVQLALPQAALWIGMIAGTFFASSFLRRYKLKDLIFRGLLIISFSTLIGVPWFVPQVISYFSNWEISIFWAIINIICGVVVNFFTIPLYVFFQKHTSDEYRGRFWGLENSLRTVAMCGGFFVGGFFAQKVWLGFLFLGTAIVQFAIAICTKNIKAIK